RETRPGRLAGGGPLRARLRGAIVAAVAAGLAVQALAFLWAGAGRAAFFWAILEPAALVAAAAWLTHRRHTVTAANLVLVASSHAAAFTIARFGLAHIAGALLVLTILLCGLLVGAYFVRAWTLICCLLVLFEARVLGFDWRLAAGWCAVYAAAGWLVALSARHLERLVA